MRSGECAPRPVEQRERTQRCCRLGSEGIALNEHDRRQIEWCTYACEQLAMLLLRAKFDASCGVVIGHEIDEPVAQVAHAIKLCAAARFRFYVVRERAGRRVWENELMHACYKKAAGWRADKST